MCRRIMYLQSKMCMLSRLILRAKQVDDPCWWPLLISSQQLCHREKYQPISWYNSLLDGNPLLKSLQNSSFRSPVIKSWDWGLSPISAILWPKSYCSAVTFDIMIFISVTSLVYDLVYDFLGQIWQFICASWLM